MGKTITVTISKYGDCKVEAEGFTGEACVTATQGIEQALNGGSVKRSLKPEYDEQAAESVAETEAQRF